MWQGQQIGERVILSLKVQRRCFGSMMNVAGRANWNVNSDACKAINMHISLTCIWADQMAV